jgi:hypothetical protein
MIAVALVLVGVVGFGFRLAAGLALLVCAVGLWLPAPATCLWLLGGAAGVTAALARGALAVARDRRGRAFVAVAGALAAVFAGWRYLRREPASQRLEGVGCVLTGYSTARGVGLRRFEQGTAATLQADPATCPGGLTLLAEEGQTLAWAARAVCSGPKAEAVVFLGGGNDDLLTGVTHGPVFAMLAFGIVHYRHRPLTPERQDQLFADAAQWSVARSGEQEAAIRTMATCARERGARFLFVHDFLAGDLSAGRSPARRAMLNSRRRAVEEAGGQFVDLEHETGGRVGVSWFADFIHPSALGHRMIARIIQDRLRQ